MSPFIFKIPAQLDLIEAQKLIASDGLSNDNFGWSVSISGTTMVIGARWADSPGGDSGSVYVFENSGSVWNQVQKLVASDSEISALFGYSVSISGSVIVVGAYLDNAGPTDSGAAYIFEKSGGVWPATETQKIIASDGIASDRFGFSVAVSGTVVAVGAYFADPNGSASGAAYIFEKSGTWPATETQKVLPGDPKAGDNFGFSVAVSGTTVMVGSSVGTGSGSTRSGAVFSYVKSGTWPALETQKIIANDGASGDNFGGAISISGTMMVVGAWRDDVFGPDSGSAYVFKNIGGVWTQEQKLLASDGGGNHNFGDTVTIDGTTLVVGARRIALAAYVFKSVGGVWTEEQKLLASDGGSGFGRSVSISGTTLVVGAELASNGVTNAGAAYIFSR